MRKKMTSEQYRYYSKGHDNGMVRMGFVMFVAYIIIKILKAL